MPMHGSGALSNEKTFLKGLRMPLCATYNGLNQVLIVTPPPADMSTCALLIPTVADSINDPFHLSAADGYAIAIAIVTVWCTGFAARALIRALR